MSEPEAPAPRSAADRQELIYIGFRDDGRADVERHPENKRRGDVERIVESIRVNGWFGEVGIQRSSGYLIRGNHRTDAAEEARRRIARARSGEWPATTDA